MYYIVEEDCRAVVKSFFFKGKEEKELERSSWEIRENYLDFLSIQYDINENRIINLYFKYFIIIVSADPSFFAEEINSFFSDFLNGFPIKLQLRGSFINNIPDL